MEKSEINLMVIQNFILHITHANEGESKVEMTFTADQLYRMAKEYIEINHTDGIDYVEAASHYLCDGDISTKEMVEAIYNHKDQNDMIDNVEGVIVWEKVENTFNCAEFLEQIDY